MKKKNIGTHIILIIALCSLCLSSCGNNSSANNSSEPVVEDTLQESTLQENGSRESDTQDVIDDKPADAQIADGNEDKESVEEKYLKNPDDSIYFAPATSDYIYVLEEWPEQRSDSQDGYTRISLYSFDGDYNLVQQVTREDYTDSSYKPGDDEDRVMRDGQYFSGDRQIIYTVDDEWADKYIDPESKGTEKYLCVLSAVYGNNYRVEFSKPFGFEDTAFPNSESPAFDQLISFAERNGGGDYKIEILNDGEKHIANAFYDSENILMHDAFAYWEAQISWFDSDGTISKILWVNVFDEPDMIEQFLRNECGTTLLLNTRELSQEQYEKINAKKNFMTDGSILYFDFYGTKVNEEPYTNGRKWQLLRSTSGTLFLSVPYLDDGQINAFYTEYDVLY